MPRVLINIDVVGSTRVAEIYGDEVAYKKIGAVLAAAKNALLLADSTLRQEGSEQGDGVLLFATDPVEIYHAAEKYQAIYRNWPYEQLPVKIAIGYGEIVTGKDGDGNSSVRGAHLNRLNRTLRMCPPARVVVTPNMFGILETAHYAHRLVECHSEFEGIGGQSTYYLSRWSYRADSDAVAPAMHPIDTPPAKRRADDEARKPREKKPTARILEIVILLLVIALLVLRKITG